VENSFYLEEVWSRFTRWLSGQLAAKPFAKIQKITNRWRQSSQSVASRRKSNKRVENDARESHLFPPSFSLLISRRALPQISFIFSKANSVEPKLSPLSCSPLLTESKSHTVRTDEKETQEQSQPYDVNEKLYLDSYLLLQGTFPPRLIIKSYESRGVKVFLPHSLWGKFSNFMTKLVSLVDNHFHLVLIKTSTRNCKRNEKENIFF
jgi:hypothetical protein